MKIPVNSHSPTATRAKGNAVSQLLHQKLFWIIRDMISRLESIPSRPADSPITEAITRTPVDPRKLVRRLFADMAKTITAHTMPHFGTARNITPKHTTINPATKNTSKKNSIACAETGMKFSSRMLPGET